MVKDLSSYIMKMAASESADMDLSTGELPVCIDADAGAHWFSIASSKSYFALAKFLNCHFFPNKNFKNCRWWSLCQCLYILEQI